MKLRSQSDPLFGDPETGPPVFCPNPLGIADELSNKMAQGILFFCFTSTGSLRAQSYPEVSMEAIILKGDIWNCIAA